VTVTFAEPDGNATLTLQQSVLESVAERHGARQGWTESLGRLAKN
jgi:hypothetical protein